MKTNSSDTTTLAGWLLADIFLVLAILWLGSQPYVPLKVEKNGRVVVSKQTKQALNTKPVKFQLTIDARGVRSANGKSLSNLRLQLNKQGLRKLQERGLISGLILTFSGGDSCSNHGSAEATSRKINGYLHKWYPSFVTSGTVQKAYVDFSCKGANRVKLEIYTFAQ